MRIKDMSRVSRAMIKRCVRPATPEDKNYLILDTHKLALLVCNRNGIMLSSNIERTIVKDLRSMGFRKSRMRQPYSFESGTVWAVVEILED